MHSFLVFKYQTSVKEIYAIFCDIYCAIWNASQYLLLVVANYICIACDIQCFLFIAILSYSYSTANGIYWYFISLLILLYFCFLSTGDSTTNNFNWIHVRSMLFIINLMRKLAIIANLLSSVNLLLFTSIYNYHIFYYLPIIWSLVSCLFLFNFSRNRKLISDTMDKIKKRLYCHRANVRRLGEIVDRSIVHASVVTSSPPSLPKNVQLNEIVVKKEPAIIDISDVNAKVMENDTIIIIDEHKSEMEEQMRKKRGGKRNEPLPETMVTPHLKVDTSNSLHKVAHSSEDMRYNANVNQVSMAQKFLSISVAEADSWNPFQERLKNLVNESRISSEALKKTEMKLDVVEDGGNEKSMDSDENQHWNGISFDHGLNVNRYFFSKNIILLSSATVSALPNLSIRKQSVSNPTYYGRSVPNIKNRARTTKNVNRNVQKQQQIQQQQRRKRNSTTISAINLIDVMPYIEEEVGDEDDGMIFNDAYIEYDLENDQMMNDDFSFSENDKTFKMFDESLIEDGGKSIGGHDGNNNLGAKSHSVAVSVDTGNKLFVSKK